MCYAEPCSVADEVNHSLYQAFTHTPTPSPNSNQAFNPLGCIAGVFAGRSFIFDDSPEEALSPAQRVCHTGLELQTSRQGPRQVT